MLQKEQSGPVRRAGVADAASGGHLPVRMETAVTDPETRKRFRTFVSSDQPDESVVFGARARPDPAPPARKSARQPRPTMTLRRGWRSRFPIVSRGPQ